MKEKMPYGSACLEQHDKPATTTTKNDSFTTYATKKSWYLYRNRNVNIRSRMTVEEKLRIMNREAIDGKCFIGPRNISWQDQEIQRMVEELNLKWLFIQVDYKEEIVITMVADHWMLLL